MEIKQNRQRIELGYTLDPCLFEKEVEDQYFVGEQDIPYIRKLQAVAALSVDLLVTGNGRSELASRNEQYAKVDVTNFLAHNGVWAVGEGENINEKEKHVRKIAAQSKEDISLEIITRMKEALPGYVSSINIQVHSAQLMQIGFRNETSLARPYIDLVVDRALGDARKLLYGE